MENILQKIYNQKLLEVRERKKIKSLTQICAELKCQNQKNNSRNFLEKLQEKSQKNQIALICEIKKGSPASGLIREDFDVVEIAKTYEKFGATCLSVLTDEKFFLGCDDFLVQACNASTLPILRKDFMVDAYQIYEAKLFGADCILLIVAMLDDNKLKELETIAIDLGLDVLIEVHNQEELERSIKLNSKLLGINSRNLKTLEVNLNNALELAKQVDGKYTLVAESGIKSPEDLKLLKNSGFNCFLIGEYFMRKHDISSAMQSMLQA